MHIESHHVEDDIQYDTVSDDKLIAAVQELLDEYDEAFKELAV